jgi:hypothetical protein
VSCVSLLLIATCISIFVQISRGQDYSSQLRATGADRFLFLQPDPTPTPAVLDLEVFQFTRGTKKDLEINLVNVACPAELRFDDKDKVISESQIT